MVRPLLLKGAARSRKNRYVNLNDKRFVDMVGVYSFVGKKCEMFPYVRENMQLLPVKLKIGRFTQSSIAHSNFKQINLQLQ